MLKLAMIGLLAAGTAVAQTASPAPSPAAAQSTSKAASANQSTAPASPAGGQFSSPTKSAESKETKKAAEGALPATTTVITVHGACAPHPGAKGAAAQSACVTHVSKKQFDSLLNLVVPPNQPQTPQMRRTLAQRYVELLAMADAAEKAGVEKSPEYALLRLRGLAEAYQRQLDEKYKDIPQAEIDAYYNQHKDEFISATLRRLYIPKTDAAKPKATDAEKADFAKKATEIGNQMQERAQKGEDMDTLEKDAYSKLGLSTTPPSTQIGPVRKGALPPATDKAIFDLQQGGVYKDDQPTAVIIYKVEKKETQPPDKVKDEIVRTLHRQKMEAAIKGITSSVKADYNDTYFGPATPATPPGEKR
ncbi:MAG TPA: peptidylprolyl isomerase [Candidatus Acidoferrales bacterium]|nr:peptidylprolyl isomerase [Candidatus Acidoferrales bacterium]